MRNSNKSSSKHSSTNSSAQPVSPAAYGKSSKKWKWWHLGALVLFVGMVIGEVIDNRIKAGDYLVPEPTGAAQLAETGPSTYGTIDDRFSTGDRAIIQAESDYIPCADDKKDALNEAKGNGIRTMRRREYEEAVQYFAEAWSLCPAPEVLIYKNNATIGNNAAHTLAVIVPIDFNPKNAIEMLRGAAQAQTEINQKGGVNGVPIKLMVIDDSDQPEVAKNIATTLIDSYPGVLAVVGHWTSGVSVAAASVYDFRRELVFMTPVSTTRDLKGETGWVFRSTINMRDAQKILADYAFSQARYKKVATFSLDSRKVGEARALYSEGLQNEFVKSFEAEGGKVTKNFNLASADFDRDRETTARKMVRQARKEGADAVMLVPDNSLVDNAEAIIREADKQGLGLLGVTNLYRDEVLKETCPAVEGLTMAIAWSAEGEANPEFVKSSSSSEFWKGEVNFATAMTYNAVQAMATAMAKDPTRTGIQTALNRPDFVVKNTADAQPMTFTKGNRTAEAQLVTVEKVRAKNQWRCDFTPVLDK